MTDRAIPKNLRRLIVICGDQLDNDADIFEGFDPKRDAVVMTEAYEEATYVWQHKRRLVFFFAAMRGFRDALREGVTASSTPSWTRMTRRGRSPTACHALSRSIRHKAFRWRGPAIIVFSKP